MNFIEINADDLGKAKKLLSGVRNGTERAIANAINSTLSGVRKQVFSEIISRYSINKTTIRNQSAFQIKKSRVGSLQGELHASSQPLPLINFKVKPNTRRSPLSATINKQSGPQRFNHAFIAKMKNGHVGVFERKVGAPRIKGRNAPIRQLFSLTVPAMIGSYAIMGNIQENASARMKRELDREINRLLLGINSK